jgi:hypothetical protein
VVFSGFQTNRHHRTEILLNTKTLTLKIANFPYCGSDKETNNIYSLKIKPVLEITGRSLS